jgi:hypothetical protein
MMMQLILFFPQISIAPFSFIPRPKKEEDEKKTQESLH